MKKEQVKGPEAMVVPVENFPDYTAVRTSKNIELKNLSHASKIRLSYLEAIEKGEFDKLPEPIYAETFIKAYAGALGEDAAILLSHYRQYLDKLKVSANAPEVKRKNTEASEVVRQRPLSRIPFKVLGWTVSVVVLIGFMISFFSAHVNNSDQPGGMPSFPQPKNVNPSPTANNQPTANPGPAVGATSTAGNVPLPGETALPPPAAVATGKKPYKLIIEAQDTSWVNIVEDDNPPYEVLLRAGERIEREASQRFSVDIGNAGGVSVDFQGKSLGRLGQKGQVVHLNLPQGTQN